MAHHHGHSHATDLPLLPLTAIIWRIVVALIVVGLLVAYGSSYTVREGTAVIVTRFGDPVAVRSSAGEVDEAGFYWKWPWPIEEVHPIDMRLRYYNTPFTATFTSDRKNVVLLTYVVWQVADPLLYFQSLGTADAAEQKLDGMVAASKNFHLGNYTLSSLVSTDPSQIKTPEIEQAILEDVRRAASDKFGITIQQIGIKRVAYPEENMEAVLEQMRAERRAEAGQLRAEGDREAQAIRNEGRVQAEQILRKGREEAGTIIGRAEKEAAEVYAKAHRLDPDFYRFWRSMQVIKKTLGVEDTIVLRSDEGPFRQLFHGIEEMKQSPADRDN
jgi:membrane protease subunit HflC